MVFANTKYHQMSSFCINPHLQSFSELIIFEQNPIEHNVFDPALSRNQNRQYNNRQTRKRHRIYWHNPVDSIKAARQVDKCLFSKCTIFVIRCDIAVIIIKAGTVAIDTSESLYKMNQPGGIINNYKSHITFQAEL